MTSQGPQSSVPPQTSLVPQQNSTPNFLPHTELLLPRTEQLLPLLPTPPTSQEKAVLSQPIKRKRPYSSDDIQSPSKQQCHRSSTAQRDSAATTNPVAYWAAHSVWPQRDMDDPSSPNVLAKRPSSRSRSSSAHWSETQRNLDSQGIYAQDVRDLHQEDESLLDDLTAKSESQMSYSVYPEVRLRDISQHAQNRNETCIQAYILPHVVPSPVLLRMSGFEGLSALDEEFNADWIWCQPFLSKRPKPDYVVGLSQDAFSQEEYSTLLRYSSKSNSIFVTPNICLPFLICEVKSPQVGLVNAERQSIHSAAIAIHSIFSLYELAYGKDSTQMRADLDSRLLVFSIIHDHDVVEVHGHYAIVTDEGTRKYYRHRIFATSLTASRQSNAKSFALNLYEKFAPVHIRRIKNAIHRLPPTTLNSASSAQESTEDDPETPDNAGSNKRAKVRPAEQASLRQQINVLIEQQKASQQRGEEMQQQLREQAEEIQQMDVLKEQQKASQQRGEEMQQQLREQAEEMQQLRLRNEEMLQAMQTLDSK